MLMVEAKMKPRKGKGTPHPKARRPLVHTSQEEHNLFNEVQENVPDQPDHAATKGSLDNLFSVHTQVTRTLHQIDALVLNIHKLASSNHLVPDEVQNFADALAIIDANLQDWNNFLKTAAERSSLVHIDREHEPYDKENLESTPVRGGKFLNLSSPIDDLEYGAISYSPLVTTGLLDCESPDGEPFISTPLNIVGCPHSSTSSSPLPQTPRMLSPPRSVQVLSCISESPLLSSPARLLALNTRRDGHQEPNPEDLSTPEGSTCQTLVFETPLARLLALNTRRDGHQEPNPEDLSTPEGSTCQTILVFETPLAQVTRHGKLNDGLIFPHTPRFGVSPPRTCRPLQPGEAVSSESDPTPVMAGPLRTPGILLECMNVTTDSNSAGSPSIVDDLTASTVKRLGPRGLEERLWQELAIRKADILQPARQR